MLASRRAMEGGTTVSGPTLTMAADSVGSDDAATATTLDTRPSEPGSTLAARCRIQSIGRTRVVVWSIPAVAARVAHGDWPASTVSWRRRISGRSSVSGFGRAENFPSVMFPSRAGTPESQTSPVCAAGISCESRRAVRTEVGASSPRPPPMRTSPSVEARPRQTVVRPARPRRAPQSE